MWFQGSNTYSKIINICYVTSTNGALVTHNLVLACPRSLQQIWSVLSESAESVMTHNMASTKEQGYMNANEEPGM